MGGYPCTSYEEKTREVTETIYEEEERQVTETVYEEEEREVTETIYEEEEQEEWVEEVREEDEVIEEEVEKEVIKKAKAEWKVSFAPAFFLSGETGKFIFNQSGGIDSPSCGGLIKDNQPQNCRPDTSGQISVLNCGYVSKNNSLLLIQYGSNFNS